MTGDVASACERRGWTDEVVTLYRSGYLDQAKEPRDISEFAYKRGAASLLDFLDAERSYRAAQLAYRRSLASYMLRSNSSGKRLVSGVCRDAQHFDCGELVCSLGKAV